jgi:aspartate/methionine/tyrosine aminotransferase
VAAIGTSLANHLAMAAVVEPGCEVLIERPAYEPLVSLALYLGCKVRRFDRGFERGFQIEAEEVRRNVTRGTRLIVITNLHNPSGVLTGETTLRQIGEIARNAGARVLVDEVYLEMLHVEGSSQRPPHAFGLGSEFITTSSLTKAYGLSGLRCGWVLAEPDLATRMWRINDLFGAVPAHPAELLSVIALERLDQIAARARSLLRANRAMLNGFLDSRPDLQTIRPRFGTIVFPRLTKGTVEVFCALLRSRYETTVVPGSFFEAPEHFRLGVGGDFGELAGGLDRLGATLDEI